VAILLSRQPQPEHVATPTPPVLPAPAIPVAPNRSAAAPSRPTLALALAFVSGLTSLGYQVLWTRLLSSGTGNSTYVFTLILAMFLIGIALGAQFFSMVRVRIGRPVALIAIAQVAVAALAILGLVLVIGHPGPLDAMHPLESARAIFMPIILAVLPAAAVLGFTFPASSALLGDDPARVAANAGRLLAVNTAGAIVATFAIPFIVIPAVGSPAAVALLALVNVATGLILAFRGTAIRQRATAATAVVVGAAIVAALVLPNVIVDPSVARIRMNPTATLFESREDEIASVQAGETSTSQLWVTGTAMTLLTVDAKLMPIIPLMLRPQSKTALTVAFGMGSAFRGALIAGLRTEAIELVPSVPKMFHYFYDDADAVLANPNGKVIITDGRNHVELTTEQYDIIVTDPPPPIESSGASVISSLEYYQAGHAHLNPGGIMMQWTPYGSTRDEFRAHLRTFHAVFPHVMVASGPGGFGFYFLGSDQPLAFNDAATREILSRPGVLEDISSAFDSRETTIDGWAAKIPALVGMTDDEVSAFTGDGPLITDDRPLPEYFLLRRMFAQSSP
jgi:predicted membrane-bound spermidine synthase